MEKRRFPVRLKRRFESRVTQKVKHSVIIPAYNEEKGLPVVLKPLLGLLDSSFEVIVVNDGSGDGTAAVAESMGVRVVSHRRNLGKGAAMRTGIRHTVGENVIFIDADGTYPPETVPEIARLLRQREMVVARRRDSENIHLVNRLGNRIFSALIRKFYRSGIVDPLSGLYGVRRSILEKMDLDSQGFEIETELTIKATQMKLAVDQIDIHYEKRIGESKLRPFKDGLRILKTILMLMLLYNPARSLIVPGLALFFISFGWMLVLLPGPVIIGRVYLQYHTMIFFSMMAMVGLQLVVFGSAIRMYAVLHKYTKPDLIVSLFSKRGFVRSLLLLGVSSIAIAAAFSIRMAVSWVESGFSPIFELQRAIFMFYLLSFGFQLLFSVFFLSVFNRGIQRIQSEQQISSQLG
ncbi:glycosyltransferase family 2 protein [bacterium]|nr:glycosyltransferase family 2 protein [bacterium]